jgi:short-subunit dehydrogenase
MLKGKIALITGASSGIGAALSTLLAHKGATVILCARRLRLLQSVRDRITQSGGNGRVLQCDVTKRAEAERVVEKVMGEFGRLDILVNNAGRGHLGDIEATSDDVLHSMFEVNVFSLWNLTRPIVPLMKKQGSGHIINVASMAGKVGFPYNSAYVAAKHACVGFTRALRLELLGTNIHASVVIPAGVLTDWATVTEGGSMKALLSESGPVIKRIAAEQKLKLPPIEGVKPPEEIAEKILDCILRPVAEVYTHTGSHEFALLAAENLEKAEQLQLPVVLGEREVYERIEGGARTAARKR